MEKKYKRGLPFQEKLEMTKDIAQILKHLHQGERSSTDLLIEDLKSRAIHFPDEIQRDVLIFCEQVHFQYDYDPWHKVTPEVQRAADQLITDLGFTPPPNKFPKI